MKKTLADIAPRRGSIYPAPFQAAVAGRIKYPLGNAFGLDQFGVNVTVLEPGAASALRHWHSAEDEFVYVLDGDITLVTDAGEEVLRPGEFVGFKAGVADGHMLVNRGTVPVRYLEVGTRAVERDAVTYPDHDLKVDPAPDGTRAFRHKDGTPY